MPGLSGLLKTKLQPARIGTNLIARPRLTGTLSAHLERRLTLVCAPAGYGKSVLLMQFAQECALPSVWYHLDEFDNDLAVFLEYLVMGIRKHNQNFGADVLDIVGKSRNLASEERQLVTCMVNGLDSFRESGLIIILDDYHKVQDRAIHEFVEQLVDYLPKGVHIVICSRSRPPMRLTRLKIQGLMLELGEKELRFSEEETKALLDIVGAAQGKSADAATVSPGISRDGSRSEADPKALFRDTHGWPAAVQLMAMSLANADRDASPASSLRTRRDVHDYLATEVFEYLSDEEKDFLTATSVFSVVTPDLADRMFDRQTGSADMLRNLAERGLFVSVLEGDVEAYRYHDLFREFLKSNLGSRKTSVLRKAGQCLLESAREERAVEYFLEAKDYDLAVQAMVPAGQKGWRNGRWQTVARWLQSVPQKQRRRNAWCTLYEAVLAVYGGKLDEAMDMLERAQEGFQSEGDEKGLAQVLIYRASVLRLRGRYDESLSLLETALSKLGPATVDLDASTEQASSLGLQGRFEESARVLNARLALAEELGDPYVAAMLLESLSTVYYMTGEYGKSVEAHQRAAELLPEPPFENNVGAIYAEWGDLDQAYEHARKAVINAAASGTVQRRPYGFYQFGIVLMHKGDLDAALGYFRQAAEISRTVSKDRFSEALNLSFVSRCLTLQDNHHEAISVAEEALKVSQGCSPYIEAICKSSLAFALAASGDDDDSLPLCEEAASAFEEFGARLPLIRCQAALASMRVRKGELDEACRLAANCLRLAAAEHCVQEFVTSFYQYKPLLSLAVQKEIEGPFVRTILKRLGDRCLPILRALSESEEPEVRLRSISPLAALDTEGAQAVLQRLMHDPDQRVSDRALAAVRGSAAMRGSGLVPVQGAVGVPQPGVKPTDAPVGPAALPSDGALYVTCMGPFRVFAGSDEVPMAWRTTKARDILAYLLNHRGGPVSKERILDDLWPDLDSDQASTLFHTSLYQLRKALKDVTGWEETVLYAGGHYRLAKGLVSTDVDRLDRLIHVGLKTEPEPAMDGGREDLRALEEAMALFHGSYLEDLDYSWLAPERGRLDGVFAEVAETLARRLIDLGETTRAATALRALLQRNPLLEEIHCLLMTCYAGVGDRLAVMQQYETLKDALDRELGVDPSPKTRSLYYQLCGERQDS